MPPPATALVQASLTQALAAARALIEFALPQRCPCCGAPADPAALLCATCLARLPRPETTLCVRCLLEGAAPDGCARHPGDALRAAWIYDAPAAAFVHALKFGGRERLARLGGVAIAEALPPAWWRVDLVTGVPLHATRRRERGHDQADGLARALADAIGAPHAPGLLERVRATRAQSSLGHAARRRNPEGAFRCAHPGWLQGRRVLVVDDVVTTGATLAACTAALRAAGARTRAAALAWAP